MATYYQNEIIIVPKEPYRNYGNPLLNIYYIRSQYNGDDLSLSVFKKDTRNPFRPYQQWLVLTKNFEDEAHREIMDYIWNMFPQIRIYHFKKEAYGYHFEWNFLEPYHNPDVIVCEFHRDIHKYYRMMKIKRTYNTK